MHHHIHHFTPDLNFHWQPSAMSPIFDTCGKNVGLNCDPANTPDSRIRGRSDRTMTRDLADLGGLLMSAARNQPQSTLGLCLGVAIIGARWRDACPILSPTMSRAGPPSYYIRTGLLIPLSENKNIATHEQIRL